MGRCSGCSGDRCSCVIKQGAGTRVTGAGTQQNPYVIEATGGGEGGSGFLPGMIQPYAGSVAPAGWLIANGQAVSRTAYSALFAAIGITYGAGDNSTTFNVPDAAGNFLLGADASHPVASVGGSETINLTSAMLPPHVHTMAHTHDMSHDHPPNTSGGGNLPPPYGDYGSVPTSYYDATGWMLHTEPAGGYYGRIMIWNNGGIPGHVHTTYTSYRWQSTGGSSATNTGNGPGSSAPVPNMPPYLAVTYLIKT